MYVLYYINDMWYPIQHLQFFLYLLIKIYFNQPKFSIAFFPFMLMVVMLYLILQLLSLSAFWCFIHSVAAQQTAFIPLMNTLRSANPLAD